MSTLEEIDKAISAHGQWKQKLRNAIDSGESESTPERVKQDNNCSFGKWLYERIDPSAKDTALYPEIVSKHAEFHLEAGRILELALNSQQAEAHTAIGLGGVFSKTSSELTKLMKQWKESMQ